MRFIVGYQLQRNGKLIEKIIKERQHIYEVYFSWGDMPSGRSAATQSDELLPHEALQVQIAHLAMLHKNQIPLNLLLNANCYGQNSLSRKFMIQMGDLLDYLVHMFGVCSVTTTSPVLAHFIKENFGALEVRASVNMEIGTVEAMEYLQNDFDGYYYKRELNKNLSQVKMLKSWCDANGKKLYMLANSGCLNFCSARQFHDNLVAHEREIAAMDNGVQFHSACSQFLSEEKNRRDFLHYMNFVRPEEIAIFEPYVAAAKLANRVSQRAETIIHAYVHGQYGGNVLDLLEPNHAALFYPTIYDNARLPINYSSHTAECDKKCDPCQYCRRALQAALVCLKERSE